ncbi:MurR/RpiR family transcriptional regulator [Ligilactobacillus agilis]|uniref:HTH rpiR-type domain-containing protein n=3 Tax=Ligilactobacillus agilis TaxID=1601 RepID=A0A0R2AU32_9LACO|nr:MurR/RpiR family transcriptional regulator [Ligilactobacillus agilis]KRM66508.1 hypothetical protein FC14_GL002013 [Ligilactobacillus agilis DSM 20509]GET09369.1 hypothetical protein SY111_19930 [Ligilactobacillus agilis]GET16419.1 hypothetical protein NB11A_07100 [Ligilactobacillus agilis]
MIMDKLNMMINYSDESSTKYNISKFIKNNINEIPNMTITQLAALCYTSKGQISKYVQSLGYETMQDFKLDCIEYIESIPRNNKASYSITKNIKAQYESFTNDIIYSLQYTLKAIDTKLLKKLIEDLHYSNRVFIYAHGHARTLCTYIQNELSVKLKEVIICDVDFMKSYHFEEMDLLLLISVDGNTFYFERDIVHSILEKNVNTWLISCNQQLKFPKNFLYVPTPNKQYSDYILRHVIDYILRY